MEKLQGGAWRWKSNNYDWIEAGTFCGIENMGRGEWEAIGYTCNTINNKNNIKNEKKIWETHLHTPSNFNPPPILPAAIVSAKEYDLF